MLAGVKALPGVERAAYVSTLPFISQGNTSWFKIENREVTPDRINDALYRAATPEYLSTLGVRLIEGRLIDERDRAGTPRVAVINETLARQFFPVNPCSAIESSSASRPIPFIRSWGSCRTCGSVDTRPR